MGEIRTLARAARTARARELRREMTHAEARLWQSLRAHRLGGWKWKRQLLFGPFFLDFACVDAKLVVEVDGGGHADRTAYDARRTAYLERAGWRVIRFWNSQVLPHRDGVCLTILQACGGEHLLSSEAREGGVNGGKGSRAGGGVAPQLEGRRR